MHDLIGHLNKPWIWAIGILGFATWTTAITLVIRSSKFLRKWLWGLLSLFSFTYGWSPEPGVMVSVGLPLGAAYIIWFWRFGPSPSPEALEKEATRRSSRPPPVGSPKQINRLRASYLLAAAATLLVAGLAMSGLIGGFMEGLMVAQTGTTPAEMRQFFDAMRLAQGIMLLGLAGLFAFLAIRPYWWGKLLCLWAGLSWGGFGLVGWAFGGELVPTLGWILGAAFSMITAAVVLQLVDPRFGGSYLRIGPTPGVQATT